MTDEKEENFIDNSDEEMEKNIDIYNMNNYSDEEVKEIKTAAPMDSEEEMEMIERMGQELHVVEEINPKIKIMEEKEIQVNTTEDCITEDCIEEKEDSCLENKESTKKKDNVEKDFELLETKTILIIKQNVVEVLSEEDSFEVPSSAGEEDFEIIEPTKLRSSARKRQSTTIKVDSESEEDYVEIVKKKPRVSQRKRAVTGNKMSDFFSPKVSRSKKKVEKEHVVIETKECEEPPSKEQRALAFQKRREEQRQINARFKSLKKIKIIDVDEGVVSRAWQLPTFPLPCSIQSKRIENTEEKSRTWMLQEKNSSIDLTETPPLEFTPSPCQETQHNHESLLFWLFGTLPTDATTLNATWSTNQLISALSTQFKNVSTSSIKHYYSIVEQMYSISTKQLWMEKYAPRTPSESLVYNSTSTSTVLFPQWLAEWKHFSRGDADCMTFDRTLYTTLHASNQIELMTLATVLGPVSSGKSAFVHGTAKALGFKIIELGPHHDRSGKNLLKTIGEATQSDRMMTKPIISLEDEDDDINNDNDDGIYNEMDAVGSDINEVEVSGKKRSKGRNKKALRAALVRRQNKTKCQEMNLNESANLSLIVLEDVDALFEQDKGFMPALRKLVQESKCPVIVTSNTLPLDWPEGLLSLEDTLCKGTVDDISIWLLCICFMEKWYTIPFYGIQRLVEYYECDVRQCLYYLQIYYGMKTPLRTTSNVWWQVYPYNTGVSIDHDVLFSHYLYQMAVDYVFFPIPFDLKIIASSECEYEVSETIRSLYGLPFKASTFENTFSDSEEEFISDSHIHRSTISRKKQEDNVIVKLIPTDMTLEKKELILRNEKWMEISITLSELDSWDTHFHTSQVT